MPSHVIQWFPGHMAKTRRLISENLTNVDIVIEMLDARIPHSSKNPEISRLVGDKPMLTVLNKSDLADAEANRLWCEKIRDSGSHALLLDCTGSAWINELTGAIRETLAEKISRYNEKGMAGRRLRAMVVGIPNVGKSTLINRMCGSVRAKSEDRPGVTTSKQWLTTKYGIDLLDMPGVLWPKFDERQVGENLAICGAIKDDVLQIEEIAMILCGRLAKSYPELLMARYKLTGEEINTLEPYDLFLTIGQRRGFLIRGGEVDERRCATVLLDEFRAAKIGRISLEFPGKLFRI